jgi:serine/threonine protein phosphatase 1
VLGRWLNRRPKGGGPAAVEDGVRIYAFGDVHGRFDLLRDLYDMVRADLVARPPARSAEVFLGDYVDRGPQAKEVLEWLQSGDSACDERVCLKGNHEEILLGYLDDPAVMLDWRELGGLETLHSFGVAPRFTVATKAIHDSHAEFLEAFGSRNRTFLERLRPSFFSGGYFFAHAGARPSVALDRQYERDLLWIREPFLSSDHDFGKTVVHGHTPVETPDVRWNRINIDTGAFATGRLTCLVLEGTDRRFLQTSR